MWFIPAIVAAAFARKIVARYWHGVAAQHASADPPGLRTVARFTADRPDHVRRAICAELARDLDGLEVTRDAIRASADGQRVDILRFAPRGESTWTVELTRAWTGVYLGEQTRYVLGRVHARLVAHARDVAWFARQDRELVDGHAEPFDVQAVAVGP